MLEAQLNLSYCYTKRTSIRPNYKKANYQEINNYLSNVDWNSILIGTRDIDQIYSEMLDEIYAAMNAFIPIRNTNRKPRFPRHIKNLLSKKKRLYKLSKTDPSLKQKYKEAEKLYREAVKQHFQSQEFRVAEANNKNELFK